MNFSKRTLITLLVTAAFALSGCTSSNPNPPKDTDANPTVSDDTGAIQGVVTTMELEPIRNAQVALQSGAADPVLTDEEGSFHFSDVSPGRHVLFATALGYAGDARTVEVVVGEISSVQWRLALLSATDPFTVTDIKEGFIACGTGVGAKNLAGYTQVECGSNDPNQEFLFQYNFARGLKGVLLEMTWKPTQALSKDLALIVEKNGCGFTCGADDTFAEVQGCCYIRIALPIENLTKPAGTLPATDFEGKAGVIQSRTFPAFGEGDVPTTVFTSQEFQIYVEYFYNGRPDDWATRSNLIE